MPNPEFELDQLPEFAPDRADAYAGVLVQAENVRPVADGYAPVKQIVSNTPAADAYVRGLGAFVDTAGGSHIHIGDETKLYERINESTLTDRSGATYATSNRWKFAAYGDYQYAVNGRGGDTPQRRDATTSNNFADNTNQPKSDYIDVWRNFMVIANTADNPMEIRWSQIGDPTTWTKGANQADSQLLDPEGGPIHGMGFSDVGYIFQRARTYRMTYVAPNPAIMRLDIIEPRRGVQFPGTLAQVGDTFFYYSADGFMRFSGGASQPIGYGRVDRFFFNDLNFENLNSITSAIDYANNLYILSYGSNSGPSVGADSMLIYNYLLDRWSYVSYEHDGVYSSLSPALTLDDITTDMDSLQISLDDAQWEGGNLQIVGVNTSNQLGLFTGNSLAATIESNMRELVPGRKTFSLGYRPILDYALASDVSCYVSAQETIGAAESYNGPISPNSVGFASVRKMGRFFKQKTVLAAGSDWSRFQGVEWHHRPVGRH